MLWAIAQVFSIITGLALAFFAGYQIAINRTLIKAEHEPNLFAQYISTKEYPQNPRDFIRLWNLSRGEVTHFRMRVTINGNSVEYGPHPLIALSRWDMPAGKEPDLPKGANGDKFDVKVAYQDWKREKRTWSTQLAVQ